MANNLAYRDGYHLPVAVSSPASPVSGNPVRFGSLTGVAQASEDPNTELTSVDFGPSVWLLSVQGVNDGGNVAVAPGDPIFWTDGGTPPLSKKASGYFFGFAMDPVGSGATTSIRVIHSPSPGSGTLGAGTVGATNLAAGAVTAAKLSANLAKGYLRLPLGDMRVIATGDIDVKANTGGVVAKDTTPIFERTNGATDKSLRLRWAATVVNEIEMGEFPYPPDLDPTQALTVCLLAKMGGSTDTPALTVSAFEGIGGSNIGGNSAALSASLAKVTVALTLAGSYPDVIALGLTPGAHGTDAIYLMAAWLEYQRKS